MIFFTIIFGVLFILQSARLRYWRAKYYSLGNRVHDLEIRNLRY